jgi:hypothetical protein
MKAGVGGGRQGPGEPIGGGSVSTHRPDRVDRHIESPWLTTRDVAIYLGYGTTSAVRNLKMRGLLEPRGRRGRTDLYL